MDKNLSNSVVKVFIELYKKNLIYKAKKLVNWDTVLKTAISDLEVDTKARVAKRGGKALDLTAKEFCLLELLALRTGHIVSRADIWEQLYDFADEADSNVIDVFINRLRKKSENGGFQRLIHTRRGLGYVLIDPDSQ